MIQISKRIQDLEYLFMVDTENNNPIFLTVVVSIVKNQETQFSKLDTKSIILKEIAFDTAKSVNENFVFILNPYDSGIEWRGQFKLRS